MNRPDTLSDRQPVDATIDRDWWRGALIYQIFPRSFQDSNGDGIGDLAGITNRLPHVASLGVDAIWISPFYRSPMLDFGYDVSDYCDVDPIFGSLADFNLLVTRAHELGLKVLIDLVLSHTSHMHPWFQESRSSRGNSRADWYVWADPKPDGTPPNNWLSMFGGSAWQWDGERMQYYLHNFLVEQPDLNFHNQDVQRELLDVARFWLERGVDGFRLDTVNFYFCDRELRDNPVLEPRDRNDSIAPSVNPYNWQEHRHDKNQAENLEFLKMFRAVLDEFPAATAVGEVGDAQTGLEIMAAYTSGGDKVHMCYDFAFLSAAVPTGLRVAEVLDKLEDIIDDGWTCWAFSNHDVIRHPSRWALSDAGCRLYASLLMSLRGSVCIYQGEELGLTEADVSFEDLHDPYGIRFWPKYKGRDGCRTPIPWVGINRQGGFSEGKPWLPMAVEHLPSSVMSQENNAGSMLNFYRKLISFRSAHPVLRTGALDVFEAREEFISLIRSQDGTRIFCAFNLEDAEQTITLPEGNWTEAADGPYPPIIGDGPVTLPPYFAYFGVEEAD